MRKTLSRPTELPQKSKLPVLIANLLGRKITFITIPDLIECIQTACIENKKITVAHLNVHGFNLSMQIPWFYSFLQTADIIHCDSVGMLKAAAWTGLKLPLDYRASYTLLMPALIDCCHRQGFSIFLLGGKPKHSQAAIERLRSQYPNIDIQGHHGYFDLQDADRNDEVVNQINQAQPNILIVGMGMPIQENWIRINRDRLNVNVIMPGGAVIDRLAGVVPDCPASISNLGLEWLYRLCREPKRLITRYLIGNSALILHIILARSYSNPLEYQLIESIDEFKKNY